MGYIIAYLLFAAVIDLLLELVDPGSTRENLWINRRLWSDTLFDCGSREVALLAPLTRQSHQLRPNRYRPR